MECTIATRKTNVITVDFYMIDDIQEKKILIINNNNNKQTTEFTISGFDLLLKNFNLTIKLTFNHKLKFVLILNV